MAGFCTFLSTKNGGNKMKEEQKTMKNQYLAVMQDCIHKMLAKG
jgi:hypothetical protein